MWHRNKIPLIVLIALLLIGGVWLIKGSGGGYQETGFSEEARSGEIKVTGNISCLPYSAGVSNKDCVKALRGDDGKMYSLNTIDVGDIETSYSEGQKVEAIGVYQPANTSVDDSSVFQYDGVLVLRKLKKI